MVRGAEMRRALHCNLNAVLPTPHFEKGAIGNSFAPPSKQALVLCM